MTERQKFQMLQKYNSFELRRYEPCVVAEVSVKDDYRSAANKAFRPLFNYISKNNSTATGISMTAPVIATKQEASGAQEWIIHFVMPAGSTLKDLPHPKDAKVVLREVPEEDCVAISFRGRATESLCRKNEEVLRLQAEKEHFKLSPETRIARFDPPFKPGFLMYNEIVIPLLKSEK